MQESASYFSQLHILTESEIEQEYLTVGIAARLVDDDDGRLAHLMLFGNPHSEVIRTKIC